MPVRNGVKFAFEVPGVMNLPCQDCNASTGLLMAFTAVLTRTCEISHRLFHNGAGFFSSNRRLYAFHVLLRAFAWLQLHLHASMC